MKREKIMIALSVLLLLCINSAEAAGLSAGSEKDPLSDRERVLMEKIGRLPVLSVPPSTCTPFDWLISPEKSKAGVWATEDGKGVIIANGMISRTFSIVPNLATTNFVNRMTGESLLRAVSSEGSVTVDGVRIPIGGLDGQEERGYIKDQWIDDMTLVEGSFVVEDFQVRELTHRIKWQRESADAALTPWRDRWQLNREEASGCEIVFFLRGSGAGSDLLAKVYIAVFDELPLLRKRFEIINEGHRDVNIDRFQLEYLAFAEPESPSGGDPSTFLLPNIHIESDYNCRGSFTEKETDITEKWVRDTLYTSQRNVGLMTPCILDVSPSIGPDYLLPPGETFSTFSTYEMPFDSYDRERKGLFTRRMYRAIAPWVTQNPIFLHLTSTDPAVVRNAVDQCADVGYEMIILSFGSGLNAEDTSDVNVEKYRTLVDYAHSKGIEMGCYSLLASRWISDSVDVINPLTGGRGGMTFGSSPCLCSQWGYDYFLKIKRFFEKTGMDCFEHDGSYPGDVCASVSHAYHRGLGDSQWRQFDKVTQLYHWMRGEGIYMNVPDFYLLNGTTKVSIGYREANWSLPRERQLIHTRQLNYDCTWERPQSALWSFVPLVEYQGGGDAATLEPLSDHLYEYKTIMFQNYGAGVQACYRGPRLYDSPETSEAVVEIISWYKKYRRILNSDIIHLRRPDARDWDGIMHVNPSEPTRALALLFNPTEEDITREIRLPLYYTGLTSNASIREQEGRSRTFRLDRDYCVTVEVTIPARGYTWLAVE